ncbi:phosphonate C-P lyase system protein PhnH [Phaeovulum sp.]|uniref:phosphonate C-P lyase system protein PhnH n=1 Tax=Phaeovulum sp. TaxID=2934796 RepID=UPI00272F4B95|nr:phosphonate C-P lyase system protein PhnH [Phaeovulum sp.]MDP1668676.1 phosphonate C-P lyase system protein PhnH [Phaeovulum sp.]MDP1963159.1 phosphonate C-P lyase system protein PhnH [Reyranella sp.]MDZ4120390.1 phosphonate C-P lyase system protein PhnH [Phaeovulum sp.]
MTGQAAQPLPDAFETRTNATFEALMWALSRPGTAQTLPAPGAGGVVEALIDRECRVYCDDPALGDLVSATGAALVDAARADHAFLSLVDASGLQALDQIPVGSALYPDAGATVVAQARLGEGQRLRLTGPGIETAAEIRLDGLPPGLWTLRAARCRYPAGFDLFLV